MIMNRTKPERPAGKRAGLAAACVIFSVSSILWGVSIWLGMTFNINFQEILYTMTSPLVGTDPGVVLKCLRACLPHICLAALFILTAAVIVMLQRRITATLTVQFRGKRRQTDLFRLARRAMGVISILALFWAFRALYVNLKVGEYIALRRNPTTIYEDRYVDPAKAAVTAPEQKKNLIHIYLESMETSYASEDVGGRQPEHNYIPNLTALRARTPGTATRNLPPGAPPWGTFWRTTATATYFSAAPTPPSAGGGGITSSTAILTSTTSSPPGRRAISPRTTRSGGATRTRSCTGLPGTS